MQILRTKYFGFTFILGGLTLCGTGLWLILSPTQFEATSTINLETDEPNVKGQVSYDPYFTQTELEIIQSPVVLGKVVEALNLNIAWGKKYGDGNPFDTVKSIKLLQSRIILEPVRNTQLLKISFFDQDPNEAAEIANAIAKAYQDFRMEKRKRLTQEGIQVLTIHFQEEEQAIKVRQENLERLGRQLNLPNSEPAEELLKSNYPSYFETQRQLQNLIEVHKLLAAKIEAEKLNGFLIADPLVISIELAESPKFPVSPNRWLGVALMVIGLFSIGGGFLLLKFSRRSGWL